MGLLTRAHLEATLAGRLGYGRALLSRVPVQDVVAPAEVTLAPTTSLAHAAAAILGRKVDDRYDDVLVVDAEGRTLSASVASIFQELSLQFRDIALRDPLTGLPNRRMLDERGAALVEAGVDLDRTAVLYIDLDGFKQVNDTLGHRVGDELLVEFASRLTTSVRPGDVVGRLGGDEFAVLLTEVSDVEAMAVANRIVLVSVAPFVIDGQPVRLSASVGVALGRDVRAEAVLTPLDVLLRHADSAMLHAKQAGKARSERLDGPEEAALPARRAAIRRRLRVALDEQSFELHYQPKLDLGTGAITSVEALLRWTDAELGPVSPAEFIPVAEQSGQIIELGRWVLRTACRQARAWLDEGREWAVAVNVSPVELADPLLAEHLLTEIGAHGLPPRLLQVEVTESCAVADLEHARRQLTALQDAGVHVHLDDFGTGYSSLAMLRHLPVTTLKVDQSIVARIDAHPADAQLLAGVIGAAHTLGMRVVAEGVERETQLERLRELGCDSAQGYLICRPAPPAQLLAPGSPRPAVRG
jgi:diguanylate cyclase (GGDEF)-like protein